MGRMYKVQLSRHTVRSVQSEARTVESGFKLQVDKSCKTMISHYDFFTFLLKKKNTSMSKNELRLRIVRVKRIMKRSKSSFKSSGPSRI